MTPLLDVRDLRLEIPVGGGTLHALRGVDLHLQPGRTLGLVGESGSGKSLTALSLLGLQPRSARRRAATLLVDGNDILAMDETALARRVRGRVAAMIFQEPMTSLNPVLPIGRQLTEVLTSHGLAPLPEAQGRALALLERVGIAGAAERMAQFPHQFSGGQRQRIMIAMALMARPRLLVADEPTTALDVTVQAEILRLLNELRDEFGMGLVLVTHNLGVVSRVADEVAVMYAGQIVEQAPVAALFGDPRHPYSRGLLAAMPVETPRARGTRLGAIPGIVPSLVQPPTGCAFAPRCHQARPDCAADPPSRHEGAHAWRCVLARASLPPGAGTDAPPPEIGAPILAANGLQRRYRVGRGLFARGHVLRAVDGVDLLVRRAEVLAVVGESGCGKSTLARLLLGLEAPDGGTVTLAGRDLATIPLRQRARLIQPVFQDPHGSLNPRQSVAAVIRRPLEVHRVGDAASRRARVLELLERVGLSARLFHASPAQLSGGQRQRVAIARALALQPDILLCDEPTSALDVSVQAQILNLLQDLRRQLGLTLILISHDLSVVRHMADRVAVMYLGQVVEDAPAAQVFADPGHPYTRALLASALPVQPGAGVPPAPLRAGFANPLEVPRGCRFAPRCPDAHAPCHAMTPLPRPHRQGQAACHLLATPALAAA